MFLGPDKRANGRAGKPISLVREPSHLSVSRAIVKQDPRKSFPSTRGVRRVFPAPPARYNPRTTMKIVITADLHYDILRSREPARRAAESICHDGGDALVLAGDTAGADLDRLREALALFADFPGRKLVVPGNHCLWCAGDENSLDRYERVLPALADECGFSVLDFHPVQLGAVGLVGSIGWYDYSFRDESLGIPLPFYAAKVAPGAAAYYQEYAELIDEHRDRLNDEHLEISSRWMDGVRVSLGMSDEQFARRVEDRLAGQLADLASRVEKIVAVVHHLPFIELVPQGRPPRFAFAAAFMGARRLGEVLLACPKVTHVYCGHSHWPDRRTVGHIQAVNIGSTYTEKRWETLEL